MIKLINRNTELVLEGKEKKIRVYSGPIAYKNELGEFKSINLESKDALSKIGNIKLYNENPISVGVRKDGLDKFMGLRPDETQVFGTEQLELTPISISLSGEDKKINIEDLNVIVDRNIRQVIKVDSEPSDFKISYILHTKGFNLINEKVISNPIIRESLSINVINLGKINGVDFSEIIKKEVTPTIFVGFIIDNHIFMSNDEVNDFGSVPPDFTKTVENWNGGSMFVKDNIVMVGKGLQGMNKVDVRKMFNNILNKILGTRGDYILKDNNQKGVVVSAWGKKDYWCYINTSDISFVEQYFKNKKFKDVGYIQIEYELFVKKLREEVSKRNAESISEVGEYIEQEKGAFKFKSHFSNQIIQITPPAVLNKDKKVLFNKNEHSLKDNKDGTYTYTKYASVKQILFGFDGVNFVDTTFNGSSIDGTVSISGQATWADARNAATGDYADDTLNSDVPSVTNVHGLFGVTRMFYSFDTSAIPADSTVSAAVVYLYVNGANSDTTSMFESNFGANLTTADFSSFSGSTLATLGLSAVGFKAFTLISFSSVKKGAGALTQYCFRDKEYDVDDVEAPGGGSYANGYNYVNAGVPYIPYMEITYSGPAATGGFMTNNTKYWGN